MTNFAASVKYNTGKRESLADCGIGYFYCLFARCIYNAKRLLPPMCALMRITASVVVTDKTGKGSRSFLQLACKPLKSETTHGNNHNSGEAEEKQARSALRRTQSAVHQLLHAALPLHQENHNQTPLRTLPRQGAVSGRKSAQDIQDGRADLRTTRDAHRVLLLYRPWSDTRTPNPLTPQFTYASILRPRGGGLALYPQN